MCSPSIPTTDPNQVASAQGAVNRETALSQGFMNNPNIIGPYGQQQVIWSQVPNSAFSQSSSSGNMGTPPGQTPSGAPAEPGGPTGNQYGSGAPGMAAMLPPGYSMGRSSGGYSNSGSSNPYSLQFQPGNYGDWLSPTWSWPGSTSDPNNQWQPTVIQTLAPAQQQMLNQQNQMGIQLGNMGIQQIGNLQNIQNQPAPDPSVLLQAIAKTGIATGVNSAPLDPSSQLLAMSAASGPIYSPYGTFYGSQNRPFGIGNSGNYGIPPTQTQPNNVVAPPGNVTVGQSPPQPQPGITPRPTPTPIPGIKPPSQTAQPAPTNAWPNNAWPSQTQYPAPSPQNSPQFASSNSGFSVPANLPWNLQNPSAANNPYMNAWPTQESPVLQPGDVKQEQNTQTPVPGTKPISAPPPRAAEVNAWPNSGGGSSIAPAPTNAWPTGNWGDQAAYQATTPDPMSIIFGGGGSMGAPQTGINQTNTGVSGNAWPTSGNGEPGAAGGNMAPGAGQNPWFWQNQSAPTQQPQGTNSGNLPSGLSAPSNEWTLPPSSQPAPTPAPNTGNVPTNAWPTSPNIGFQQPSQNMPGYSGYPGGVPMQGSPSAGALNPLDTGAMMSAVLNGGLGIPGIGSQTPINSAAASQLGNFDPLNAGNQLNSVIYGSGAVPGLGQIQNQINTWGIPGIPSVDPWARQHAEDTAYQAATARLDPQWQQAQAQQETQLRNQGLVPGEPAYDNAMRTFSQAKNDAYQQAQANAVTQGLTNQQAQFGMGLAANQTGFGQQSQLGQFANQAQAQRYGQNVGLAGLANQAQGQGYAQSLSNLNALNQAQQQQYAQNLGMGALAGQLQGQAWQQGQGNLAAANAAEQQQFNQNQAMLNQYNAVQGNQFNQGLASAGLQNAANNQLVQQYLTARQLPLNELNAFRTGAQVQVPQFQQFQGAQQVAPNIAQIMQNNQNAQTMASNNYMSGLAGLGGSILGSQGFWGMMASDRRLKSNIVHIGTHPLGIGIYEYDIFGHRARGVMADELEAVMPEAVMMGAGGYKMVNYAMIGGLND